MYERLMNKNEIPTFEEILNYSNDKKEMLYCLHKYLINDGLCNYSIRFPYGNKYGWSLCYRIKNKLICDVFTENNSFTVMLRLNDIQYMKHYNILSEYTKKYIDNRYPCSNGGWIHYRVIDDISFNEIKILLKEKFN